jgi:16S rRNA processing protein RimM
MSDWADVAELTKAKNLEGGLFVRATKGLPFLLSPGLEVTFVPPVLRIPRSSTVRAIQEQGDGRFVVFFEDITSIDTAEKLIGHHCLVRKADLPEGWDTRGGLDLVGFSLVAEDGSPIGSVVDVQENPAHPLLVVEATGREVLVPLVEELLVDVDEEALVITVSLPEGLLEL